MDRVGPETIQGHRRGELGRKTYHPTAVLAVEVRVVMIAAMFARQRVAVDALRSAYNGGDTGVAELDEIAIDGGLIPIRLPEPSEHLGVRKRILGVHQNAEHCESGRRRAEPALAEKRPRFFRTRGRQHGCPNE